MTIREKVDYVLARRRDSSVKNDGYLSQDYINIPVVGPARQGKSRFLQTLTGLDERYMPIFGGIFRTIESVTFENYDSDDTCVELTFKTEEDILRDVQGYVDIIAHGKEVVTSLSELPSLGDKLDEWIRIYNEYLDMFGSAEEAKEIIKERYIKKYDEWINLVENNTMTLYDGDDIKKYICWHDVYGDICYHRFVAVKSVNIKINFGYEQFGRIRFVDTLGFGGYDDLNETIDIIKNKGDGVIFIIKPSYPAGADNRLLENVHFLLRKEFGSCNIEKWLGYILNTDSEKRNLDECLMRENYIIRNVFPLLHPDIIDVTNRNEVINDFLVPYLNRLIDNMLFCDDCK